MFAWAVSFFILFFIATITGLVMKNKTPRRITAWTRADQSGWVRGVLLVKVGEGLAMISLVAFILSIFFDWQVVEKVLGFLLK